MLISRVCDFFS